MKTVFIFALVAVTSVFAAEPVAPRAVDATKAGSVPASPAVKTGNVSAEDVNYATYLKLLQRNMRLSDTQLTELFQIYQQQRRETISITRDDKIPKSEKGRLISEAEARANSNLARILTPEQMSGMKKAIKDAVAEMGKLQIAKGYSLTQEEAARVAAIIDDQRKAIESATDDKNISEADRKKLIKAINSATKDRIAELLANSKASKEGAAKTGGGAAVPDVKFPAAPTPQLAP